MHSLVRLYIKTAVGFLVAGLVLGGYLLAHRELFGVMATRYEISAHTRVILVGFITNCQAAPSATEEPS